MSQETFARIEGLKYMSLGELKDLYGQHFGERPCSAKKQFFIRRLAWKFQADATGQTLSTASLELAGKLAAESHIRSLPPSGMPCVQTAQTRIKTLRQRDPRLPLVGSLLTRQFKGTLYRVEVLGDGFHFNGAHYASLSAVARAITGTNWNGYAFFGLNKEEGAPQ